MLLVVAVLVLAGCASQEGGSASTTGPQGGTSRPTDSSTGPPGTQPFKVQKVDVEGRPVALSCKGNGPKTVVFLGDIGQDAMQGWGKSGVPDGLTDQATVCIYDRPGLGESDAAATPRSITNQVKELNSLITASGMKTPVYLVAQGYGTIIARQLAKDNRPLVAGMALVDPPLWGLDLKTPDNATPGVKAEYDYLPQFNADLGLYGAGALPPGPIPTVVLGVDGTKPALPETTTAAEAPFSPTTTVFPLPDSARRQDTQRTLAQKSPFGKFEVVEGAGSYAQYWKPPAVVDAIKKLLASPTR